MSAFRYECVSYRGVGVTIFVPCLQISSKNKNMSFQQNTVAPYEPATQNVTNTQVQVNSEAVVTQVIPSVYSFALCPQMRWSRSL